MGTNDAFWKQKKTAAFLKHGLLTRYLPVFVSKVGSTAPGQKVGYIDGFAGPGTYKDGSPGSPFLVVQMAKTIKKRSLKLAFGAPAAHFDFRMGHWLGPAVWVQTAKRTLRRITTKDTASSGAISRGRSAARNPSSRRLRKPCRISLSSTPRCVRRANTLPSN